MPGISDIGISQMMGGKFSWTNYWSTRYPSALAITVNSSTQVTLSWTNNGTVDYDGVSIEQSTDGVTYAEVTTVAAGETSKAITGLTANTLYHYKIRYYKGTHYSAYSSAVNDWTAFKIPLAATGTGAGVATIRFWFDTTNIVATLDGTGKFYSDAAGTLNESASYTFPAGGLQLRYLKVTSGSSNMLVFAKGNMLRWGDSAADGFTASTNAPTTSVTLAALPPTLEQFRISSNTVSGDIASLPSVLTYFSCLGSNTVSGDIASLPSVLTYFSCTGSNTVSGDIASLPSVLTYFYCAGSNTVSGDIASLPSVLTYFICIGSNTVSGDIASLPSALTYFICLGGNTVSDYTSGRTWANNMNTILIDPLTGGLDSTEVDNLLIDLANVSTWAGSKSITLVAPCAARTSASDAAVTTLIGKGVTVTTP